MTRALTILITIVLPTLASPLIRDSPDTQVPLNTDDLPAGRIGSEDVEHEGMRALLDRYAPVVKLSIEEDYYPSSIDYMLPHYNYVEHDNGDRIPANHSLLTPGHLDELPSAGGGLWMSISTSHNPQPFLDSKSAWLLGPAGQEGHMKRRADGRGLIEEPVYGFWVDQGRGIVDLWYWTFYPFNFGKPVGPFGILGNHVGDWEHLRMRTINGSAVSVDYHSHNGGAFSAGTTRWSDVVKVDDRPVGYSAAGSHGLWPTPGEHVYAELLNLFKIADITDDDGAVWDTKGRVEPVQYWTDPERRRRMWHRDDDSWLNYRGRWGNKGENDCWWYRAVGICQLVDAPPGPNRSFGSPPDCIVAPLVWESSTYSFYISSPLVTWAENHSIAYVQVEQTCSRPRKRKDDGDDDDDDDDDDDGGGGDDDDEDDVRIADYLHDTTLEEDLETWSVKGMTPFAGRAQHKASVLPCKGVRSAVKSYRIALCMKDGRCISTSGDRKVCSYQEGKKGYRFGHAVNVDDIDDWRWDV